MTTGCPESGDGRPRMAREPSGQQTGSRGRPDDGAQAERAVPSSPPPPFAAVEISPGTRSRAAAASSNADAAARARQRQCCWRSKQTERRRGVLCPLLTFAFFVAALAGTAVGYALAIERRAVKALLCIGLSLIRFASERSKTQLPRPGTHPPNAGPSDSSSMNTPAFLHACFAMGLTVELYAVLRSMRTLVRRLRARKQEQENSLAPEELPVSARSERNDVQTPRFLRAFFQPAKKALPSPAILPDYNTALTQGARQHARREAATIGWTAGRRGREMIGTGDAEDLELERLRRMGSIPPQYRSSGMRGDKVVERGQAPARSVWRLSHLSALSRSSAGTQPSSARLDPPQVARPSSHRSWLARLSFILPWTGTASPTSPSADLENRDTVEPKTPAAKPASPNASPVHLRQRSQNGSYISPLPSPLREGRTVEV